MDLSGPLSFNGKPAAAGFEAAIKRINASGGVNGKKINLQVLDDASDIAKGRANLLEFVSNHDLASFGYILSDVSAALIPLATQKKIPIVGLGGPDSVFVAAAALLLLLSAAHQPDSHSMAQLRRHPGGMRPTSPTPGSRSWQPTLRLREASLPLPRPRSKAWVGSW